MEYCILFRFNSTGKVRAVLDESAHIETFETRDDAQGFVDEDDVLRAKDYQIVCLDKLSAP